MKRMVLIAAAATLVAWITPGHASDDTSPPENPGTLVQSDANPPGVKLGNSFSLEEVIELALVQNPDLLAIRNGRKLARARLRTAGQWPSNPELEFEYEGDDLIDDDGARDWQVGVSQAFELRADCIFATGELAGAQCTTAWMLFPAGRDADPRRGLIQAGKTWSGRDRRDPLPSIS